MPGQLKQHNNNNINNNNNNKTNEELNGANHLITKNNVIRKHYKYASNTTYLQNMYFTLSHVPPIPNNNNNNNKR